MPSLSDLPAEIDRGKFAKALSCLGFLISKKGGRGSHFKATYEKNQKVITLPSELYKQRLKYVLKEIEDVTGVTWDDIKKYL